MDKFSINIANFLNRTERKIQAQGVTTADGYELSYTDIEAVFDAVRAELANEVK